MLQTKGRATKFVCSLDIKQTTNTVTTNAREKSASASKYEQIDKQKAVCQSARPSLFHARDRRILGRTDKHGIGMGILVQKLFTQIASKQSPASFALDVKSENQL